MFNIQQFKLVKHKSCAAVDRSKAFVFLIMNEFTQTKKSLHYTVHE